MDFCPAGFEDTDDDDSYFGEGISCDIDFSTSVHNTQDNKREDAFTDDEILGSTTADDLETVQDEALMQACSRCDAGEVRRLLQSGASILSSDSLQRNALIFACSNGIRTDKETLTIVIILHDAGINLLHADCYGMTSLMYACRDSLCNVVYYLSYHMLKKGLDYTDNNGFTALMWACTRNNLKILTTLLNAGADVDIRTKHLKRAVDIMNEHSIDTEMNNDMKKLLSRHSHMEYLMTFDVHDKLQDSNIFSENAEANSIEYGDLEVFLDGIGLSDLISVFHQHCVQFHDLLTFDDKDLIAIGVKKLIARKRILDSLNMTHKSEWLDSAVPTVSYNCKFTVADSAKILANTAKHTRLLASTVGSMCDQISVEDNQFLENKQELLSKYLTTSILNSKNIQIELYNLQKKLNYMIDKKKKVDLITRKPLKIRSPFFDFCCRLFYIYQFSLY